MPSPASSPRRVPAEAVLYLRRVATGFPESLSQQLPSDLLMNVELAGVHALADLVAVGAKHGTPLDEEVDHVIIEWEQGITLLAFGFEHDSLGACGFEDLADRSIRVTDRLYDHGDSPR
jgi:hypothetical protein